jgi:hypothetical protein
MRPLRHGKPRCSRRAGASMNPLRLTAGYGPVTCLLLARNGCLRADACRRSAGDPAYGPRSGSKGASVRHCIEDWASPDPHTRYGSTLIRVLLADPPLITEAGLLRLRQMADPRTAPSHRPQTTSARPAERRKAPPSVHCLFGFEPLERLLPQRVSPNGDSSS